MATGRHIRSNKSMEFYQRMIAISDQLPHHERSMILPQKSLSVFLMIGVFFTLKSTSLAVDFARELKPILETKCLSCHNPNNAKEGLSFAERAEVLASETTLVVPGNAKESDLYRVTVSEKAGERPYMPEKGDPLTEDEARILHDWINEGADWPEGVTLREASKTDKSWWAYQKLQEPKHDSIDAYVRESLQGKGLTMNPPSDARTLIRRATYDLTGLPPSVEEVQQFKEDHELNPQLAYSTLVNRLLESPHYGERWGRHWLDVIRFGESNGFERNFIINSIWPFRDYVIRSLNKDKPFDQFIREHLAGDVFGKENTNIAIGSAFLVAGPYDDVGNQDPVASAQIRANTLDEMINATGEAFLGMTLGCARCHDHKFDPILQSDYYQLYATFAGVQHGETELSTLEQRQTREADLGLLNAKKAPLEKAFAELNNAVRVRAHTRLADYKDRWTRPKVDRRGTEERFDSIDAKFVRFICEAQDSNPASKRFNIDEFEIWSASKPPRNVALARNGASAEGEARKIEDFADAYSADLAIDGRTGARFLSASDRLTITLAEPTPIERILFSSAKGAELPGQAKFTFVADYRIEVSLDGKKWIEIANGHDREPLHAAHQQHRLETQEITAAERAERRRLRTELAAINAEIAQVPAPQRVWLGSRTADGVDGPFHLFLGGSPQKKGKLVVPASLSTLSKVTPSYVLSKEAEESERRQALADWIIHPDNPLTPRVLANRLWHYHFGTGIVDTPNDFGYMGGRPTHPALLDFLAIKLKANNWRLKELHRLIMMSEAYQQSSTWREEASKIDGASRYLWRFPPRRLSAEEIRDTILTVSGKLDTTMGGPGFQLYHFQQDNVATYAPRDRHGPETYRRAVYHQNARASVVDLMTEYDQPDCAFSTSKRSQTTTPLQALTMLNHSFTIDMAEALAERVSSGSLTAQVTAIFSMAYQRSPTASEQTEIGKIIASDGLRAVCRAILNSSELIYLD